MAAICFIVGHGKSASGGYDSGAVSGNYHEFKIAREIAKYAYEYFNATYAVSADLMNYNGNLYLTERIKQANSNKYQFIAEIHLNAGGGKGAEVFYSINSAKTGKAIAAAISKKIALALDIVDRGAKTRKGSSGDYFGIIRQTSAEAVLVECAFIDNAAELNKLKTPEGQKVCGIAIAQAMAAALGIKAKSAAPVTEPSKKVWYFNKCNAKYSSIVDALKSLGYNSSFSYRKKIAAANGIKAYIGTAKQNTNMLNLLKQGKLIKP